MNQVNKDNDLEERFNFLIQHPDIPIGYYSYCYPLKRDQIRKYNEIVDWFRVRHNQNIKWDIPMLDEFRDQLNVDDEGRTDLFPSWLSFNRELDWDMDMVKNYESDLRWEYVARNETLLYNREFYLKYSNKLEPHLQPEKYEDLDRIMLKGEMTKEEMIAFFTVNEPFLDYASLKRQRAKGIPDYVYKPTAPSVWSDKQIVDFGEQKGWMTLSSSDEILWNIDLLRKFKDKLTWRMENEKHGDSISENSNTFWTSEMIDEFNELLDFQSFSYKTNVEWSLDLLKRYQDLWDYYWLATNKIMWQKVFPEFIDDGKLEEVMAHCNN